MRVRSGAAALAAGLLLPMGCTADDSGQPAGAPREPATSGPDSAQLLVHGTVTRGDAPVAGARLMLTLAPEDLSHGEPGETTHAYDGEPVETDEAGRYAITLDPDELSSRYFNGDYLNFDVNLFVDDQVATWSSTVWLERHAYWRSDDRALVGDPVMDMSFDLDAPTITVTDSYGKEDDSELPVFRLSGGDS